MRIHRKDFNYAKAAHKPTAMTLRLVDAIVSRETLLRSTVHGTKDFAPLDQEIITAIKGKLNETYIYNKIEISCEISSETRAPDRTHDCYERIVLK